MLFKSAAVGGVFLFSIFNHVSLAAPAPTLAAKKSFVFCSESSPSKLSPQTTEDGTSLTASQPIYEGLIAFKKGESSVVPKLAESWKISKDNLTYTFKLRKGVKFHTTTFFKPTRDFNADDVLYSFNRQSSKAHPLHSVGQFLYYEAMSMGEIIKDIKKIDQYTLQFVLSRAEAPFLADMAMPFASVISEEYGNQLVKNGTKEKIDLEPVGTGPYIFIRYDKDQMIRYEANNSYWGGRPKMDKLVFSITPDANVRFQKLKTGECDLMEPAPSDLAAIRADNKLVLMERAGLNTGYLAMNTLKKPLDNVLVRKAINHALNRQSYIDAIYLGNAMIAKNPFPPTIWSYDHSTKDYAYSPDQARELLKKAGLPNGFETELWTLPVTRPYNPNGKKMGEMMQADLAKVGIKVKLVTYDWPTYLKKRKEGEHSLLQIGWTGDNGDPDNFLDVLLSCDAIPSGSNDSRWCNPEFQEYVKRAKLTSNQGARTKLYENAQRVFKKDAPWVTLAHAKTYRAMQKDVEGYVINPFAVDDFIDIGFKKTH